ncbi:MAG: hypothetical protein AABZ33_01165 [Chloroflexota bacterium]
MAERKVRQTPEAEHLAEQERLFSELTEQLATRETNLATLGSDFARFRAAYLIRFAPLYAELDRLEADIARILAERMHTEGPEADFARERAETAEARAAESGAAAEDVAAEPEALPEPGPDLKALYRQVAKAVHPDLAADEHERARRTQLMAAASAAYAAGDEAALTRMLDGEAARPEAIVGDDTGARLVRTLRQIAQVRRRLAELDELSQALEDDPMWLLFDTVRARKAKGEDPLGETEVDLLARINSARAQLEALRLSATGAA